MHFNIYRIIDVNLNRATEGLRVIEEICRFVLEDPGLTLSAKKIRGEISRVLKPELRNRNAAGDVGKETYTSHEGQRGNIGSIFRANMKRAQEAVRCLEEFSKLIDPKFGRAYKNIRFKLYELEKKLTPKVSMAVKLDFDLYVISDPIRDHFQAAREAIAGGAKAIQLRDKCLNKTEYSKLGKKIAAITHRAGVTFILNDHWDLVRRTGADGVHLGQEDLAHASVARIRKQIGEDKIIGISAANLAQAKRAEKAGADYIGAGPVFSTANKPSVKPVGLRVLRKIVNRVKVPVVAIGGINKSNIDDVLRTGCQRAAVINAVVGKSDMRKAVRELRKKLSGGR